MRVRDLDTPKLYLGVYGLLTVPPSLAWGKFMGLITVYFHGDEEKSYRKCMIDDQDLEFFLGLGVVRTQDEAMRATIERIDASIEEKMPEAGESMPEEEIVQPTASQDVLDMFPGHTDDPDLGWGKPGSERWHNSYIDSLDNVHDLYDHVLNVTGQKMTKAGALYNLKRNAMKRIKEHLENVNDNQSE